MSSSDAPLIHPPDAALIAALDGELPADRLASIESHIAACAACRSRSREYRAVSSLLEDELISAVGAAPAGDRNRLLRDIHARASKLAPARHASRIVAPAAAVLAVAAALALALVFLPQWKSAVAPPAPVRLASGGFEVNGESFLALPYSNPDLPLTEPRIVEMRISVSSLAGAGIVLEPVSNPSASNRSVLADVLLGLDGQPLGIHVLATD